MNKSVGLQAFILGIDFCGGLGLASAVASIVGAVTTRTIPGDWQNYLLTFFVSFHYIIFLTVRSKIRFQEVHPTDPA